MPSWCGSDVETNSGGQGIKALTSADSIELKNPSRNLIDTLHDMDQVQTWMHEYLVSEANSPLAFVGDLKSVSSFEMFAQKVRSLLGISYEWYRAFSVIDAYAPLIFINFNDSINGRLFSLLHEFSHICIGENSLFNDRYSNGKKVNKTETLCNAVAAEILVPQTAFINSWNLAVKENDIEQAIEMLLLG